MAINPVQIIINARDNASAVFDTLKAKIVAVGVAIAAYFGISLFTDSVKDAAAFEAKLSELKAVSGATAAEMALLKKAAEDAGKTTKYTATEAATAMGNLARAGLSATDTIAALPAVLKLASAGGVDLGQASEYITAAIMGMGLSFSDAGRVADVLAMGANASKTSVAGMAQALSYAAPLANTLGLSLETTVAIIGKFADAGIDASRAGTALNAIMAQFADPASKFREELAGAGITTNNFEQALRELAKSGQTGERAIAAVGTEAGPALRAMLNQGIGALDALKAKLLASSGSAEALAKMMEDNLGGAVGGLSSAWDSLKLALGTPVLPVLKDGVEQLTKAIAEAVSNGTIGRFGDAIATAFDGAIKWVKAFAAEVDFTAIAARMQAFAAQTQAAFKTIGEYSSNASDIVKTFVGVMSAGFNAIKSTILAFGADLLLVHSKALNFFGDLASFAAKVNFGPISTAFRAVADEFKLQAGGLGAASEALGKKSQQAFIAMDDGAQQARKGWAGLTAETEIAGTATTNTSKAVSSSADKVKALNAALAAGDWDAATKQIDGYASAAGKSAAETKQLSDAAKSAAASTKDLAKEQAAFAKATAEAFGALGVTTEAQLKRSATAAKGYFDQIKKDGSSTAADVANAFVKYAEKAIAANGGVASEALKVEAAMAKVSITTDETGKAIVKSMVGAENAIAAVADAYHQLGIKTPEELNKIAQANAAAWDKVKNDSRLSVADLQKAFTAYATSAIDANGGVASEALKAEAAMAKISITTDETGKTIVKAMGTGGEAIKGAAGYMDAFQRAAKEATAALEKQNAELEHTLSVEEKALDLKERAIDLQNRKNNVDRQGFTLDKDGNRMVVSTPTDRSVYEQAKGQGLSETQALQIMNEFIKNGQQTGWNGQGAQEGKNWYTALQEAIDKIVLENARKTSEKEASAKSSQTPANTPAGTSQSASTPASSTASSTQNHTYTVNIPNYGTVNVASASDASSLTSIIDQLARAKAAAGV